MQRAYLVDGLDMKERAKDGKLDPNFKMEFEHYLAEDNIDKLKPKYDLNHLNEQRLEIFEKKEEVIMRQAILNELAASQEPIEIDIMSLTKSEL